ncbi:MAG TPA: GNAT family N-acetyltransferase [Bacteroidetes bacterium]|nr:GNAT family N-acetyltransferase [Bacteroidota bacterium]
MSEDLSIRSAELADLPRLKPLWLEFMSYHAEFGSRYQFFPDDWPGVLDRFTYYLRKKQGVIFVAEQNNRFVGYVFGFIFNNVPGFYPRKVGFINDFIVIEPMRHSGVGKKLAGNTQDWFSGQGVSVVQLYIAAANEAGFGFWRKCGFENYLAGLWKNI